MLNTTSVKARFAASVAANILRAGVNFLSTLLIARGLQPGGYGDFMFLLGTFLAVRSLMDMGCANAFYTFISQRSERIHYRIYGVWLAIQFGLVSFAVSFLLPQPVLSRIWLGHSKSLILLAFMAVFVQQQVWPSIAQIGEATRKTIKVQGISLALAMLQLILTGMLYLTGRMTLGTVLLMIVGEFAVGCAVGLWLLLPKHEYGGSEISNSSVAWQYWRYCKPLIMMSWIGFLYEFLDRWMLQRFGGHNEQGLYQIAYQFAAASLIATASILNILWKEIAEASARQDEARIAALYRKACRTLVLFSAALSGFLAPWTDEIVHLLLGNAYTQAAPILALMFFYPIHQSLGQISSTLMLARGCTKLYMRYSVVTMLISLPVTYFLLAPTTSAVLPGLGLGAFGQALKIVVLNVLATIFQVWLISRYCRWPFDWAYQVVGIGGMLLLGYLAKVMAQGTWHMMHLEPASIMLPAMVSGAFYALGVALLVWWMPWLIGSSRQDLRALLRRGE